MQTKIVITYLGQVAERQVFWDQQPQGDCSARCWALALKGEPSFLPRKCVQLLTYIASHYVRL